jgi:hypothetical protein
MRKITNPKTILTDNKIDGPACNWGKDVPYNNFVIWLESEQKWAL